MRLLWSGGVGNGGGLWGQGGWGGGGGFRVFLNRYVAGIQSIFLQICRDPLMTVQLADGTWCDEEMDL